MKNLFVILAVAVCAFMSCNKSANNISPDLGQAGTGEKLTPWSYVICDNATDAPTTFHFSPALTAGESSTVSEIGGNCAPYQVGMYVGWGASHFLNMNTGTWYIISTNACAQRLRINFDASYNASTDQPVIIYNRNMNDCNYGNYTITGGYHFHYQIINPSGYCPCQ